MSGSNDEIKETPQQAAMVEMARNRYDDYKQRWMPVQKQLAAQIQNLASEDSGERKRAEGKSAIETQAKFGEARGAVEKALTNSGRGPGSAAFNLGTNQMAGDLATSKGSAINAADAAVDNAYVQGLSSLMALGRGEKATATQGMQQVAQMSARQAANDAESSAAEAAGWGEVAGTGLGVGLNAKLRELKAPNVPVADQRGFGAGGSGAPVSMFAQQ